MGLRKRSLRRRSRERRMSVPEVTLTPLIDTVLALLVIFMVTTPVIQHGIKVELPQGQVDEVGQQETRDIIVYIAKDGTISVNDKKVASDKLLTFLQRLLEQKKDQTVYVHADRTVDYGRVIKLVDDIKYVGGIKYVALVTEKS